MNDKETDAALRMGVAVHEVSHAIVAYRFKLGVSKVTMDGDLGEGGIQVRHKEPSLGYLAAAVAGYMGQAMWFAHHGYLPRGKAFRECEKYNDPHDLKIVSDYGPGIGVTRRDAEKAAVKILKRDWWRIEKLAKKLNEKGKLSGGEF